MTFYETGIGNGKTILLLPGTCCNWQVNFNAVLPFLSQEYHVIAVNYDGFDGAGTEFTTMVEQIGKIEDYIIQKHGGHIDIVYGSSLGGSFVGLLMQRRRIHMDHGILGSSDLDQSGKVSAWLSTNLMGGAFYGVLKKGTVPDWIWKICEKKLGKSATESYHGMLSAIGQAMQTVSKKSMKNEFYSDLITPLEDHIKVEGTQLHVFYALQMGRQYRERYEKHFADPDIIEQDYGHEELLFCHPKQWVEEIRSCCGGTIGRGLLL